MRTIEIAPLASQVMQTLTSNGFVAYLAGGSVRDALMGKQSKDIDIVTNAVPWEVGVLFPHHVFDGAEHGVVKAIIDGVVVDIATMRNDGTYTDGRRPDKVEFTHSIEEDVLRRDFTVNGLIAKPDGEIVDLVGGLEDLERKQIKAIGAPDDRFQEDHLRMLRAIRFAAKLNFGIDEPTFESIIKNCHLLESISQERIWTEFWQILESKNAVPAINILNYTGLMEFILPEVLNCYAIQQDPIYHPEGDVLTHTLGVIEALSFMRHEQNQEMNNPTLILAGLLHDIGKAKTSGVRVRDRQYRISHKDHENIGADMAETALRRLTCPTAIRNQVCWLVENHMRAHKVRDMRKSKLMAFLREAKGVDCLQEMVALQYADAISTGNTEKSCFDFFMQVLKEPITEQIIESPLLIDGNDLITLGMSQGKNIGVVLKQIRELQDAGDITDRTKALAIAAAMVPQFTTTVQ